MSNLSLPGPLPAEDRTGRVLAIGVVLGVVGTLLAVAFKWRCGIPAGLEGQYLQICYSDVPPLFFAERLDVGAVPYLDHPVEYPPLTGLWMWLAALPSTTAAAFFGWTSALFVVSGGIVGGLLARTVGVRRTLVFAAAPTLWVSGAVNWDLPSLALATAGLVAHRRGRAVDPPCRHDRRSAPRRRTVDPPPCRHDPSAPLTSFGAWWGAAGAQTGTHSASRYDVLGPQLPALHMSDDEATTSVSNTSDPCANAVRHRAPALLLHAQRAPRPRSGPCTCQRPRRARFGTLASTAADEAASACRFRSSARPFSTPAASATRSSSSAWLSMRWRSAMFGISTPSESGSRVSGESTASSAAARLFM